MSDHFHIKAIKTMTAQITILMNMDSLVLDGEFQKSEKKFLIENLYKIYKEFENIEHKYLEKMFEISFQEVYKNQMIQKDLEFRKLFFKVRAKFSNIKSMKTEEEGSIIQL